MVMVNEEREPVVLITTDKRLEDIMLREYPRRIHEDQCIKKKSRNIPGKIIYAFTWLERGILEEFLIPYTQFRYEVIRMSDASVIKEQEGPKDF